MSFRKKILWVSHFLPFPAKGGAQIRSFNLIKELSRYHDVSLFCLVYEDVVINYFDSLGTAVSSSESVFSEFCVDFALVPIKKNSTKKIAFLKSLFSGKSYSVSRLNVDFVRKELQNFIGDKKFDAVHFDTLSLCSLHDMFSEEQIVLNHHNIESLMMYRRAKEQNSILMKLVCYLDAWKIENLERYACKIISVHIVCSDLDGHRLKALYPSIDTITIPNGIDCSAVIDNRQPDGKSLLFIGGLDWYPNADAIRFLLTKIWPRINESNSSLNLDIIGKNPPSDIRDLANQYNNVRLHGFVDDIAPYYRKAWLYVCPIKDGGGTKLKVLDAMANGVPLVAHPIAMEGIEAEIDKHYLCATRPHDFVDVVLAAALNPEAIEIIGAQAKHFIFDHYNYESIGLKLSNIY